MPDPKSRGKKKGASTIVRELELELEHLQKRVDDVAMLVCIVGPKDPRSGPFIARRVRELLGMKLVEIRKPTTRQCPPCLGSGEGAEPAMPCYTCGGSGSLDA